MPETLDDELGDDNKQEKTTGTTADHANRAPVLALAALVVAALALGLAGWSAVRGASPADPSRAAESFSAPERADAEARLCEAFETVRTGVALNTNAAPPGGPEDHSGAVGVLANARLSLSAGGQYLLSRIAPAAPEELATEARDLADLLAEIGAKNIAGIPTGDSHVAALMQEAERLSGSLSDQCGGR